MTICGLVNSLLEDLADDSDDTLDSKRLLFKFNERFCALCDSFIFNGDLTSDYCPQTAFKSDGYFMKGEVYFLNLGAKIEEV
jgi:hypothetical protein